MNKQNYHHKKENGQARLPKTAAGGNGGQVLLIVALVATIILTLGLSVSHISQQEIKIAKLEEDSKRAFAAAEAGLEAAIRLPSGTIELSSLNLDQDISGQAIITIEKVQLYRLPQLAKDEQFTFYLSEYTPADPEDPDSQQQFGPPFIGNMSILRNEPSQADYCNNSTTKFAVELSFINVTTNTITRRLIDECSLIQGSLTDRVAFAANIDVSTFPSHLLLLRIIAPNAGFVGAKLSVSNQTAQWYPQGKTITSTANTGTNVTKKLQLFQSYPQIPADFFVTSF